VEENARTPLIAGNWKMHKNGKQGAELVRRILELLSPVPGVEAEIVVCPPFTALCQVREVFREGQLPGCKVGLGAQNMHWEQEGAFTGEISPLMLREFGCEYVIVGHSERRILFGESDAVVNRKVKAACENGLRPILCVGEDARQRQEGRTQAVVEKQVTAGLAGLTPAQIDRAVVAYEPVWAIGTGSPATGADAQEVAAWIRRVLQGLAGTGALGTRILYGGSVKPDNIADFAARPDIDGALVGGASLEPESFAAIVQGWG